MNQKNKTVINMKNIEKKIKYFNELKEIDVKVLELEKIANACNNNATNLKIKLSCDKIKENKPESVLDSDGSLMQDRSTNIGGISYIFNFNPIPTTIDNELSISETVDQKHFFIFINYMLEKYNKRREFLIDKLNEPI